MTNHHEPWKQEAKRYWPRTVTASGDAVLETGHGLETCLETLWRSRLGIDNIFTRSRLSLWHRGLVRTIIVGISVNCLIYLLASHWMDVKEWDGWMCRECHCNQQQRAEHSFQSCLVGLMSCFNHIFAVCMSFQFHYFCASLLQSLRPQCPTSI